MRIIAPIIAAALLIGHASPSAAQEVKKKFGNWEVSIDTDRFSGQSKVIAATIQNGNALAVRCFTNGISVVVGELGFGPGRFDEGMEFEIKFRADKNDILESPGKALSDKIVSVSDSKEIARQMRRAKEAAFRLSFKGVVFDKVFKMGAAAKALDEVFKACPEPA